jgi:glycosyltransferase involved in cell wall biosynthesis
MGILLGFEADDASMQLTKSEEPQHSIIVPAYEEEQGLPVVLEQILSGIDSTYEVIVVDDGSGDSTAAVARRFPCCVIRHDVNQGKGMALRTGILHSRGINIVWIDGDATYPADRIPDVVRELEAGYDLVVGRREYGRRNIPILNRVGNGFLRLLAAFLYRRIARDPFSGLCGVKRRHLERMSLASKRFGIEMEVAVKAAHMKLRVGEVPIAYGPRIGYTKLNGITAGLEILLTMLRFLTWSPPAEANDSRLVPQRSGEGTDR